MRNKKGVTLIELMIVIGLLSVIIVISGSAFLLGFRTFNFAEGEVYDQRNIKLGASSIVREARVADLVEVENANPAAVKITMTRPNGTPVVYQYVEAEGAVYKDGSKFVIGLTDFTADLVDKDSDSNPDVLSFSLTALEATNSVESNVRLR